MPFEFKFADVGEGITEGEIVSWKIKEGDTVAQDQVLLQVETDKAIVDIPSPQAGTILKIHHKEGDTIKVGEVLVTFGDKGEKTVPQKPVQEKKSFGVVGELEEAPDDEPTPVEHVVKQLQKEQVMHMLATPATRRLAREFNLDINTIKGTGANGRITEEDVRKAHEGQTQPEKKTEVREVRKYDDYGHIKHIPLKGMRKTIAQHMTQSLQKAAHVTHMEEIDMTEVWNIKEKEKKKAEKKGIKLTFLPFIMKAVIAAIKEDHPYLNAALDDEHEDIILKEYFNIGFAVDTPEGLMVPVIKGAEDKSILDIAKEIETLADAARKRTIDIGELKGGTFTITNIGSTGGGIFATPIINYPEAAILALGAIREQVRVIDGKMKIRKIMPISLAFDHRILDGAEAAKFTNDLKEHLEDPDLLLVERD